MSLPRVLLLSFFASNIVLLGGCASEGVGAESSATSLTMTDGVGLDVQVLQVWTPGRVYPELTSWHGRQGGDVSIDAANPSFCPVVRSWASEGATVWDDSQVDCTDAFAK